MKNSSFLSMTVIQSLGRELTVQDEPELEFHKLMSFSTNDFIKIFPTHVLKFGRGMSRINILCPSESQR